MPSNNAIQLNGTCSATPNTATPIIATQTWAIAATIKPVEGGDNITIGPDSNANWRTVIAGAGSNPSEEYALPIALGGGTIQLPTPQDLSKIYVKSGTANTAYRVWYFAPI